MNGLILALGTLKDVSKFTPVAQLEPAIGSLVTKENREDVEALVERVDKLSAFINEARATTPESLEHLRADLTTMTSDIESFANQAKKIISHNKLRRFLRHESDKALIAKLNDELKHSMDMLLLSGVTRLQKDIEIRELQRKIDSLPYAEAAFDSRAWSTIAACYEGTRHETLQIVQEWLENISEDHDPIFWLYGPPGIGKTAVSKSIAAYAHNPQRAMLGGSFFFSVRIGQGCPDGLLLFSTLALQLARFDPSYYHALGESLKKRSPMFSTIDDEFESLFLHPLTSLKRDGHPIVIVIDGLDDRPESYIRRLLEDATGVSANDISDIEQQNEGRDIETYLHYSLNDIAFRRGWITPWLSVNEVHGLATRAAGLFIFAATVVRFVDETWLGPAAILAALHGDIPLKTKPLEEIDRLYLMVLHSALPPPAHDPDSFTSLLRALFTILAADMLGYGPPPPVRVIQAAFKLPCSLQDLVKDLHSVLKIPQHPSGCITAYHKSFLDFIVDEARCGSRFAVSSETMGVVATKFIDLWNRPYIGYGSWSFLSICGFNRFPFKLLEKHIGALGEHPLSPQLSSSIHVFLYEKIFTWLRSLKMPSSQDSLVGFHDLAQVLSVAAQFKFFCHLRYLPNIKKRWLDNEKRRDWRSILIHLGELPVPELLQSALIWKLLSTPPLPLCISASGSQQNHLVRLLTREVVVGATLPEGVPSKPRLHYLGDLYDSGTGLTTSVFKVIQSIRYDSGLARPSLASESLASIVTFATYFPRIMEWPGMI
ncbi:hypothetical protein K474DRAFT_1703378 [Panus rudis PR-1116 ss-1]|nr:hypothetical protein K474DRAFT_1703378 [Panus rudis PR-1116 ss-1]